MHMDCVQNATGSNISQGQLLAEAAKEKANKIITSTLFIRQFKANTLKSQ